MAIKKYKPTTPGRRGMTVTDLRRPAPEDCHTSVAVKLDQARFWNLITDAVKAL